MSSWNAYPKILSVGPAAVEDVLRGPVVVEEKIDGSQFSFGVFDGELEGDPRDIPKIMGAVQADLQVDEIRDALWKWAWPQIKRKSVAGLAGWYKQQLLEGAFDDAD